MKKCPFCKAEIADDARFCLYCMSSLEEKKHILPRKRRRYWPLVLLVILLVLGLGCVLLAMAWRAQPPVVTEATTSGVSTTLALQTTDETPAQTSATASTTEAEENEQVADGGSVEVVPNPSWMLGGQGNTPTEAAKATEPSATKPTATEPPATKPAATEPPATKPAATEPPATKPAATEPPATKPAATEPPATKPAATEPPATKPTATEPPATEPPATEPAPTETTEATEPAIDLGNGIPGTMGYRTQVSVENPSPEDDINYPFVSVGSNGYGLYTTSAWELAGTGVTADGNQWTVGSFENAVRCGIYYIYAYAAGKPVVAIGATGARDIVTLFVPDTVVSICSGALCDNVELKYLYLAGDNVTIQPGALPPVSSRWYTLVIRCSADCKDGSGRYWRDIAGEYGAVWEEWNG